jgi:uncharacterized protein (DUF697 family)
MVAHSFYKQADPRSLVAPATDVFLTGAPSLGSTANQRALMALSDPDTVRALILGHKQQNDVPALKGAWLAPKDLDENPQVLRNILIALAERYQVEAQKLELSGQRSHLRKQKRLTEAYQLVAKSYLQSAASIKTLTRQEELKFGTRPFNGTTFGQRLVIANAVIHAHSGLAGTTAFFMSPIPGSSALALPVVTWGMLTALKNRVYRMGGERFNNTATGLSMMVGAGFGPQLTNVLLHAIPAVGSLMAATADGASAALMHQAFGWFFFTMFEAQIAGGERPHMPRSLEVLGTYAAPFFTAFSEIQNPGPNRPESMEALITEMRRTMDRI